MIRIIHRCMTESKLTEKNWNGHFAFMHLGEFKNHKEIYLNGKKLKWWNRFKNGDVIEVIDKPHILTALTIFASIAIFVAAHPFIALGIVAGLVGTAITDLRATSRGAASTTQNKEYSSATQPELRGASNDISSDIIPVTFGTVQQTPSYAQTPYRLVQDGTGKNKYHQYFIPNYNNVTYSDFKLGETPITNYVSTYYDINTASASNEFIGYDNCKALSIDEELSYDKAGGVNEICSVERTGSYTVPVSSERVDVTFTLYNIPIVSSKFTQKTYSITLTYGTENPTSQTKNVTISYSDLTSSGSHVYTASKYATFNISINRTDLTRVVVAPVSNTRNNSDEILDELNIYVTNITLTISGTSLSWTPDQRVNKYDIIPSEIIQTSPLNTTEIDVITSFPQGMYKINQNSGNRLSRSTAVEIMYKLKSATKWEYCGAANKMFIRDINGDKIYWNSGPTIDGSSTTYENGRFTFYTPTDLNVADQLFFRPVGIELPAGQYDVRVRCADFKEKTNYDVGVPHCSEIQFRCSGDVVNPSILATTNQIAFEVTAYKNLSGTLKKFNYIASTNINNWTINTWTTPYKINNNNWYGIVYSKGKYLAAGGNGYITTSTDGINWTTPYQVGTNNWNSVTSRYAGSRMGYVVAGDNGYISYTEASDEDIWVTPFQVGTNNWYCVKRATKHIAVGANGYISTSSSDGTNWTTPIQVGTHNWYGVAAGYISFNYKYIVVGENGYITTSTDGTNWTTPIQAGTNNWRNVIINDDTIIVVGDNGYITKSTNGTTWTTPIQVGTSNWNDIIYVDNKYFIVGNNGYISTSTNGTTWTTPVQTGINNWYGIINHDHNEVIIGANGYVTTSINSYNFNNSNPAAVVRYLLTDSRVNPRAESLSHIDDDSLVEYYAWCEAQGYKADGIVSEACKIGEVVDQILKNSQAAMIPLYNGKHTFVIDKPDKIPVGLFNQHNSWNFKWTPNVGRQTEAIRASFIENDDWTEDELTLYWYNGAVHDEPLTGTSDLDYEMVKKEYKYVCDRASVRKIVAYELETIQTKRNQFEFDVNLEAMNMMLLDRIYVSNTTNMQNESTGLIKSVVINNGNLTGFNLYSEVDIPENAKIIIRSLDYSNEKSVINIYDVTNSGYSDVINIEPIPYDGIIKGAGDITGIQDTWHYDGDLFTLGQDTIYDCTITNIKYNDDGTATIICRDYGFNN